MSQASIEVRESSFKRRRTVRAVAALSIVSLTGVIAGCGGSSATSSSASSSGAAGAASPSGSAKLALVAYSTPKSAYDALIKAYEKTSSGNGVSFNESFGASGAQSRAVAAGQPADVVAFSTTPDITRLVKAGVPVNPG